MSVSDTELHVTEIPGQKTVGDIRILMSSFGIVSNIIMGENKLTHFLWADVDYLTHEDAEFAMNNIDGMEYSGSYLKVEWRHDPIKSNGIILQNLPLLLTKGELFSILSEHGTVKDLKLSNNLHDVDSQSAFVVYESSKDTKKAYLSLTKLIILGKKVIPFIGSDVEYRSNLPNGYIFVLKDKEQYISDFIDKTEFEDGALYLLKDHSEVVKLTQARVGGYKVPFDIYQQALKNEEERSIIVFRVQQGNEIRLERHLEQCGDIVYMMPVSIGVNTAAYMVTFQTKSQAEESINKLDNTVFDGQYIPVRISRYLNPQVFRDNMVVVQINELPIGLKYKEFRQNFSQYNPISCTLVPTRENSLIGFVLLHTYESAKLIIKELGLLNAFIVTNINNILVNISDTNFSNFTGIVVYDSKYQNRNDLVSSDFNAKMYGYTNFDSTIRECKSLLEASIEFNVFNCSILMYLEPYINAERKLLFGKRMFISSIPKRYTTRELRGMFSNYGQVDYAFIAVDPSTGESTSRGQVLFSSKESAIRCISDLPGTEGIKVQFFRNVNRSIPNIGFFYNAREQLRNKVFASGLAKELKERRLKTISYLSDFDITFILSEEWRVKQFLWEK